MANTERGKNSSIRVLAVDDSLASLALLQTILSQHHYSVITAVSGREAMEYLDKGADSVDIILLDRIMPEMNGIEVCKALKADTVLRNIPIIMQTAADRPEEIREGLRAGVFYYLTKPIVAETLLTVVSAAVQQVQQHRQLRREMARQKMSLGLIQALKCTCQTLEEGDGLSTFLANFFPDPDQALIGISELLINAVEHGNLGISYEEKSSYVADNSWDKEIEQRLADPLYADRRVTVVFEKKEDYICIQITDEGDGFDWKKYMGVDPSRAMHNHGRGIAMANMLSFDRLQYNEKGNRVTAVSLLRDTD